MAIAENQVVSIEYTVKDVATGEVVDSNVGGQPLSFITGKQQIIPGLENQVMTMSQGENGDVHVAAADAYGTENPDAVQVLPREQFAGIELAEGMALYGQGEDGQTVQVTVKAFDDENVTIDFNHPLAGKDLMFTVAVLEVREPTADEAITGQVGASADDSGCCGTGGGSGCGCN